MSKVYIKSSTPGNNLASRMLDKALKAKEIDNNFRRSKVYEEIIYAIDLAASEGKRNITFKTNQFDCDRPCLLFVIRKLHEDGFKCDLEKESEEHYSVDFAGFFFYDEEILIINW